LVGGAVDAADPGVGDPDAIEWLSGAEQGPHASSVIEQAEPLQARGERWATGFGE
jgi:hypothetical protein